MINPMFDLTDKVAVITGGNGGIGLGIAKGLAGAGANIVVIGRNESKIDSAVNNLKSFGTKVIGITADVSDQNSVESAIRQTITKFKNVDILVNNAGISIRAEPQQYSLDQWDQVLDTNLKSIFMCSKTVHPHMTNNGGGSIINIGSMTSIFGSDWSASYAASKGGTTQLTKSLAIAWARYGIRVNCILPGWIDTELTAPIEELYPERYTLINQRIPTGRWGTPDDMAGVAVFLSGAASEYVTGSVIPVDGGYSSF